ncbi:MAG: oligosaccharide flippase family protein [Planctomycetes bacterium]|nr:oligosaccharide flippase family protein [Planctomycetota bacterium]
MQERDNIGRDTLYMAASSAYVTLVAAAANFIMAMYLDSREYGMISQIYLGINFFFLFQFSFITVAYIQIPVLRVKGAIEKIKQVNSCTFFMSFSVSLLAASLFVTLRLLRGGLGEEEVLAHFVFLGLLVVTLLYRFIVNVHLQSWRRFALFAALQVTSTSIGYFAIVASAALVGIKAVLLSMLINNSVFVLLALFKLNVFSFCRWSMDIWRTMWKMAMPLFLQGLISFFGHHADRMVLTLMLTSEESKAMMALYSIAMRIWEALTALTGVIGSVLMVRMREKYAAGREGLGSILNLAQKAANLTAAWLPPLCALCIMIYHLLIVGLLSEKYTESLTAMRGLSWLGGLLLVCLPYRILLSAIEKFWLLCYLNTFSSLFTIVGDTLALQCGYRLKAIVSITLIANIVLTLLSSTLGLRHMGLPGSRIFTLMVKMLLPLLFFAGYEYFLWRTWPVSSRQDMDLPREFLKMASLLPMACFIAWLFNRDGFFSGLDILQGGIEKARRRFLQRMHRGQR